MKNFNENNIKEWDFKTGQHLHGDVVVTSIENLPDDFDSMKIESNSALAYGEATGHVHKLFRMSDPDLPNKVSYDLRVDDKGDRWLKVIEPVVLKHQEHEPRIIPCGLYKINIQREYDVFSNAIRRVVD